MTRKPIRNRIRSKSELEEIRKPRPRTRLVKTITLDIGLDKIIQEAKDRVVKNNVCITDNEVILL